MIKRLAVPFLVIAAGLWGCSSSSTSKIDTGAGGSGGGSGGTGGGTGGTGGGTGGTGGTGGAAPDAGPAGTGFCAAYNMATANGALPGIAAVDYCTKYNAICMFSATAATRYANMMDCVAKYTAQVASVQSCRAAHVCNAEVVPAMRSLHCDHSWGIVGMVPACTGTNAPDGGAGAEAGASADFCAGYVSGTSNVPGIGATDFCTRWGSVCTFGAGAGKYASMDACMTSFTATAVANQTCRTNHLCNAVTIPAAMVAHCGHSVGGNAVCM